MSLLWVNDVTNNWFREGYRLSNRGSIVNLIGWLTTMVLKKDHRIAQQLGILVNQQEVGTSKIA